jgi:hypothetical protein
VAGETDRNNLEAGIYPKVPAGENFIIHLDSCIATSMDVEDPYALSLEIEYDTISGRHAIPHTDSGTIRGSIQ